MGAYEALWSKKGRTFKTVIRPIEKTRPAQISIGHSCSTSPMPEAARQAR